MKKKILSIVFLVLILISSMAMTSCGKNKVKIYLGNSKEDVKSDTLLNIGETAKITQSKEKIKNSELTFNQNNKYKDFYFVFDGNNIENISMTSNNKTILYENYSYPTSRVHYFEVYLGTTKKYKNTDKFHYYFSEAWDNGEFDNIRDVYFDGDDYYTFTADHDDRPSIGYVGATGVDDRKSPNGKYFAMYLDEEIYAPYPVVTLELFKTKMPDIQQFSTKNLIRLGKTVTSNSNKPEDQNFLWRYELLFYNSRQNALKNKDTFDYSDLKGETLDISVNYKNKETEKYKVRLSFDNKGNVIAKLSAK
ncbi:MAG: hypothetical protein ACI4QE_03835 [Acutalibacteraceae bacterium]